jgi:hypothetical protein
LGLIRIDDHPRRCLWKLEIQIESARQTKATASELRAIAENAGLADLVREMPTNLPGIRAEALRIQGLCYYIASGYALAADCFKRARGLLAGC